MVAVKGRVPRITLLGSNSGRNVGDAAIMASILDVMTQELPDAEFYVPSSKPSFIDENYGKKYRVKGVSIMPWTLSVRLVGLTTFWAIAKSDIALICDGIIFGKRILNPFFNWLIMLVFVVPWARLTGCKVICYSCGIGPFPSRFSRWCARSVINGSDMVIMREYDSKKLCEEIGVVHPIQVTGDAAFLNQVSDDSRATEMFQIEGFAPTRPLLGVNINSYFDAWLKPEERTGDTGAFIETVAESVRRAMAQSGQAFEPLVFSTHPMDETVANDLAARLKTKVINNTTYSSHEMQAAMRRCELFLGMRFHSVVLASAVEVPVVGLIYMPKVRGFMRYLDCEEYGIELSKLSPEHLSSVIVKAWNDRVALKAKQKAVVDELKAGSRRAATLVRETFFPEYKTAAHTTAVPLSHASDRSAANAV